MRSGVRSEQTRVKEVAIVQTKHARLPTTQCSRRRVLHLRRAEGSTRHCGSASSRTVPATKEPLRSGLQLRKTERLIHLSNCPPIHELLAGLHAHIFQSMTSVALVRQRAFPQEC